MLNALTSCRESEKIRINKIKNILTVVKVCKILKIFLET